MDVVLYSLLKKKIDGLASGVSSVHVDGTNLIFKLLDGTILPMEFPSPKNGVSINNVYLDESKHLIVTLSDNTNIDVGLVPTSEGKPGKDGKDGQDGKDGATPFIGENGNWWIGDTDTGHSASGGGGGAVPDGVTYINFDESGEDTGIVAPLNADTLGGHPVDYFATAEDLEDLNIDIENVDGLVYVDGEITETDYYVPINADLLDGYKASDFVTVESLGSLSNGQLTAAKAIADQNGNVIHTTYVTENKVSQMIQNATGGTADIANNALALNGHPASYFATATQLTDILNQAKTYAKTYANELVNGYLDGES